MSVGKNLRDERMKLCARLWSAGISAEHSDKNKTRVLNEYQYCESKAIPWIVNIGEAELEQGNVKLRNVAAQQDAVSDKRRNDAPKRWRPI